MVSYLTLQGDTTLFLSKKGVDTMAKYTPKKKQQLKRVRSFIRRAEKRGYEFPEELKRNLSSLSTQKLKALKPEKLYKQAQYRIDEDLTISGEKGRKIERTLAAKKSLRTRMINKYGYAEYLRRYEPEAYRSYKEGYDQGYDEYEPTYNTPSYDDYIPSFTDIVLSNVMEMIEDAKNNPVVVGYGPHKTDQNATMLEHDLKVEIDRYGRDKVAEACENAPDQVIVEARETIMASSSDTCRAHISDLLMIITSAIPTIDEMKKYQETEAPT